VSYGAVTWKQAERYSVFESFEGSEKSRPDARSGGRLQRSSARKDCFARIEMRQMPPEIL